MFNDIFCDRYDNKDECLKNANYVKTFARKFGVGQRSFIGPGSEKKWYSAENSPQGAWDHIADEMLLEFAESGHPTFRATTPLSRCGAVATMCEEFETHQDGSGEPDVLSNSMATVHGTNWITFTRKQSE